MGRTIEVEEAMALTAIQRLVSNLCMFELTSVQM